MNGPKNITQYLAEAQARVIYLRDQIYQRSLDGATEEVRTLQEELNRAEDNWAYVATQAETEGYDPEEYGIDQIYERPDDQKINKLLRQSHEENTQLANYTASFIAPARLHFSDKLREIEEDYVDVRLEINEYEMPKIVRFQGQELQIHLELRGPTPQIEGWRKRVRNLVEQNRMVQQVI